MRIKLGKMFRNKKEWDCENIICPIENYNRIRYLNLRMLIRVLCALPYMYFLGRRIFYDCNSAKQIVDYIIRFTVYYIATFYLLQLLHEFIHLITLPNPFAKRNKLLFLNKKRIFTVSLDNKYHIFNLIFSLIMPFIIFSIIPILLIYFWRYDLFLLSLSLASTVLCSDDILNVILLLKHNDKELKTLTTLNNCFEKEEG